MAENNKTAAENPAKDKRTFAHIFKDAKAGQREAQYEVGLMYSTGIGVGQDVVEAVNWLRRSAESGLPDAQYQLATRYAKGVGVDKDDHQAVQWYLKAVDQGHAKASFRLGKFYAELHHEAAIALLLSAAEAGLAQAQYALGSEFAKGASVARSAQKALHWYQQAALQGFAPAQYALADAYAHGHLGTPDLDGALIWYRKAAQQDFPAAKVAMASLDQDGKGRSGQGQRKSGGAERRRDEKRWIKAACGDDAEIKYNLGLINELGLDVELDVSQAKEWYLAAAMQGHAKAQLNLARLLNRLCDDNAGHWYQRAAEQGESDAQFALGRIFLSGQGVDQDALQGMFWYLRAAAQGDARALMALGNLFDSRLDHIAVACFLKAAQLGVAEAQYLRGKYHEAGNAAEIDINQALHWYQLASQQGHAQAQSALGDLFLVGKGVAKDCQMALEWFQKAAEQGDPKARWNLSLLLISGGEGVNRDLRRAFVECQKAAEAGFVPAQATLGVLFARMKKFNKAVEWWAKAAVHGDPEAQYNLAQALSKGQGVVQDSVMSFQWFIQAAHQGVVPAQSRLGLMYAMGEGVALDPIEAHKWFIVASAGGDKSGKANRLRSESVLGVEQIEEAKRRANEFSSAYPLKIIG
ncbi:MAG: sel1 repeat family protein [Rhodoferax sp.]|nr:sel1 repeat family protein [Rhodoferax sp.]